MSNISGTNIAAPVVPFDTADKFPTHKSVYGQGGWHEVSTFTDLALIPVDRQTLGMAAYVVDTDMIYTLRSSGWLALNDFAEAVAVGEATAENLTASNQARDDAIAAKNAAQTITQQSSAALAAGTVSDLIGNRIYATRAALTADTSVAINLYALVIGDTTLANNDLYKKTAAAGTAGWSDPLGFLSAASVGAQAWAQSPTAPDPNDATSKSAKSWSAAAQSYASAASVSETNAAVSAANAINSVIPESNARKLADLLLSASPSAMAAVLPIYNQVPNYGTSVNGEAIGAAGTGILANTVLIDGDDFTQIDIVGPAYPYGRYFPAKAYGGARGNDSSLIMYDADPLHTGYKDSNRGYAVGFGSMSIRGGTRLRLQARTATAHELPHLSPYVNTATGAPTSRTIASAAITTVGWLHVYAGPSAPVVWEHSSSYSPNAPGGDHPSHWLVSTIPDFDGTIARDEIDFPEGTSTGGGINTFTVTNGVIVATHAGTALTGLRDGNLHTFQTLAQQGVQYKTYLDGVLKDQSTGVNANTKNAPQYFQITHHVTFGFVDALDQAAWASSIQGSIVETDYWKARLPTSAPFYKAIAGANVQVSINSGTATNYAVVAHPNDVRSTPSVNMDYNAQATFVLPSAISLWGDATVSEQVQFYALEEFDPFNTHLTATPQFPSGCSYDSGSRTVTIDWSAVSGNSGRIWIIVSAYKASGSACRPLRIPINRGPNINTSAISIAAGIPVSIDLYALADCGSLVSDKFGQRAKRIVVSGLTGSGLSYDDFTGLVTGTSVAGNYNLVVSVENNSGQIATATIAVTIGTATAYTAWNDGGWYDASDDASVVMGTGTAVTTLKNKQTGNGDLTAGGSVVRTTNVKNGLSAILATRNVSSNTVRARLSSLASDPVSVLFQGASKPWTVLMAYQPTDDNGGIPWSVSASLSSTDSEFIAMLRRTTTANALYVKPSGASAVTTNFTPGNPNGSWRVIAMRYDGTKFTAWDTSLKKSVDGQAVATATISNSSAFRLFAVLQAGTTNTYSTTQCSEYFAEAVISGSARSDIDIQKAITDMANKWGITLS